MLSTFKLTNVYSHFVTNAKIFFIEIIKLIELNLLSRVGTSTTLDSITYINLKQHFVLKMLFIPIKCHRSIFLSNTKVQNNLLSQNT